MEFTHLDLFSGIGGFALAARWAGIKTVQFVEIDKFCQQVLRKNFPGIPIHDDIKTFTYANWNGLQESRTEQQTGRYRQLFQDRPFLLTGGFPCQPFSCAGKRRGKEDDRYLWEEMLRVIKEFKPTWIIGENVNGIRSMEFKDGVSELEGDSSFQEDGNGDYTNVLDGICNSLEEIGYEVQPIIIPACAVGAPHRRDRVWIVAHTKSERSRGKSEKICGEKCRPFNELLSNTFNTDRHAADTSNQGLPGCERPGSHEQGQTTHGSTPERNHAWDEPWIEAATRLCRVDARVSNRVDRLKALGNAIVPQVAFEIMKAILKVSG